MEGYEAFNEAPASADLAGLSRLAEELANAEAQAASVTERLEAIKMRITDLSERQIPELMDSLGVAHFRTTSGFEISVRKTIRASIPVSRREEAMEWLDAHGHGGIVKRNITVGFNRDQEQDAATLESELGERFENVKTDRKVEPSTLRAFIAGQLEAGAEVPLDLFGAWEQRVARVSRSDK